MKLWGRLRYFRWMVWYWLHRGAYMPEPWEMSAEFRPHRTDDLKAGWAEHIGQVGIWRRLWLIEPEDGGSYVGYWAWEFPRGWHGIDAGWTPECDLAEVKP